MAQGHKGVRINKTGCGFDSEFGGKWETECLNTRFPLPILLYAEYCVKLKKLFSYLVTHIQRIEDRNGVKKLELKFGI